MDEAGNRGPCSQVFEHTNTGGILEVTGLTTDKNPRRFKSWEWGCTTEKTLPCEYRHTINNKATHLFDSKATYSANNRANTTGKSNNLWYLHVQAKNTKRESNVKSVSVRIDRTKPATPNSGSVTYRVIDSRLHSLEVTFEDLLLNDRVELYNRSNCQGNALGKRTVGSDNRAVITFKATGNRQKYYAKVIDKANNSSGCGAVFTYPDNVLPVLPAVTGLTNDDVPRQIKRWTWGCTTEATHPCDYRYEINDDAILDSDAIREFNKRTYSNGNSASTNEEGDWYLHVQARNRAGESSIKSVSAEVDRTPPKTPTSNSMSFVSSDNHRLTVTFSDSGILQGERISIYNVSDCRGRTLGSEPMANNNRAVITFTATSSRQKYYAQVVDVAGNKGGCGFIFSYPSVPAVVPVVTGLTNDDVPRQTKRWTWGCSGCTYRHAINRNRTHTFESGDAYSTTHEATKGASRSDDGRWYIHVQAKTTEGGESRVRTVYARIDRTPPATPTKNSIVYDVLREDGVDKLMIQFSDLDMGDTVKVYTIRNGGPSSLKGTATVDSDETFIKFRAPIGATNYTDYCVQVIDQAKNASTCNLILTYPARPPQIVLTTPVLNESKNYLHDRPTFTVEKASGHKIELYADSGTGDDACENANCCNARGHVEKVADKTCPTTEPCTIKVDADELSYPEGVDYETYKFYVKKEYDGPDRVKAFKCSTEATEKANVVYNLWPYNPLDLGGDRGGCFLSKLGEISCWKGETVGLYDNSWEFNQCLPPDGDFEGEKEWIASFDPMKFTSSVNLGCRSGSGSNCPKYTALAVSFNFYYDGDDHYICAILDDQKVKCWGKNEKGQLGLGHKDAKYDPSEFEPILKTKKVKAISAGFGHACVILDGPDDDKDKVGCWGHNNKGQLGLNSSTDSNDNDKTDVRTNIDLVILGGDNKVKAISAGHLHTCSILKDGDDDGRVKCWGDNANHQLGTGTTTNYGGGTPHVSHANNIFDKEATNRPNGTKAKQAVAGTGVTCIINETETEVICLSSNGDFDINTTNLGSSTIAVDDSGAPRRVFTFKSDTTKKFKALSLTYRSICILSNSDEVDCFGKKSPPHKHQFSGLFSEQLDNNKVKFIATGSENQCAYLDNDQVNCWGFHDGNTLKERPFICPNDASQTSL